MATGQSLLNLMEVLNAEFQLQTGEEDVSRALVALNAAQDLFEARLAAEAFTLASSTGTITTTLNTETTAFPTGVLRIDALHLLDSTTLRPTKKLEPSQDVGGLTSSPDWPWSQYIVTAVGAPSGYWTNGRNIYWTALPDATYSIRWHGLQAADDITVDGTFAYPDVVMLPLASLATKLLKTGLDDATDSLDGIAAAAFDSVIETLEGFRRDGPSTFNYRYFHET